MKSEIPRRPVPPEEFARRKRACQALAEFFRARPGEWIDIPTLETQAGRGGWRTRVSEVRRMWVEPEGGTLENKIEYVETADGLVPISRYRYLSYRALRREAGDFVKGDVTSGSLFPPEHLSGWQETR